MLSDKGFMGLLHQETVYDDPNGLPLRREVYHRLIYHSNIRMRSIYLQLVIERNTAQMSMAFTKMR